jgi:hypothetical protein
LAGVKSYNPYLIPWVSSNSISYEDKFLPLVISSTILIIFPALASSIIEALPLLPSIS